MHACVVNGCNYPTTVPIRSIRGTGTPVCVRLTRSARPGHVAAGPTTRAHARKQTLPTSQRARKHVRRGGHLLCAMDSAIGFSLIFCIRSCCTDEAAEPTPAFFHARGSRAACGESESGYCTSLFRPRRVPIISNVDQASTNAYRWWRVWNPQICLLPVSDFRRGTVI